MRRPSPKPFWVCTVSVLVLLLLATLWSLPHVRIEYHKWRLESTKARKARLLGAAPSGLDKVRLQLTGNPVSGQELDNIIRKHEGALVALGFLRQENLP